jgi:purine-binding chemotaxis protein CheW
MVTFSLGGKDYSIDIMQVKEIARAGSFTFVPNTAPFVTGVYNLRGDIIPVIDLRVFFSLPVPERAFQSLENMLIISCQEQTFGIIVDYIDRVISVDSARVRPPHPLFGDINIKYISAVVESGGDLYILLDIDRIFGRAGEAEEAGGRLSLPRQDAPHTPEAKKAGGAGGAGDADMGYQFVTDALLSLKHFTTNGITSGWVKRRYEAWKKDRGKDVQLKDEGDASAFLEPFFSPSTGALWSRAYADAVYGALPDNSARQINVWNPGCGKGYEAYSLACILRKRYPGAQIKIFAQDIDLINVSNASLLTVSGQAATDWYAPYLSRTASGACTFNPEIKEMVFFEYHDILHTTAIPPADVIFCRDVIPFLSPQGQKTLLADFREKLKGSGVVFIGENESLAGIEPWREHTAGPVTVYTT